MCSRAMSMRWHGPGERAASPKAPCPNCAGISPNGGAPSSTARSPATGPTSGWTPHTPKPAKEAETFWADFPRGLKARGLNGPKLAIAAAYRGLRTAIERAVEATWQRCRSHWMRNALM